MHIAVSPLRTIPLELKELAKVQDKLEFEILDCVNKYHSLKESHESFVYPEVFYVKGVGLGECYEKVNIFTFTLQQLEIMVLGI